MIRVMSFQCVKNHKSNKVIGKKARTLLICWNVQVNIKIICTLQEENSLLTSQQIVFIMLSIKKSFLSSVRISCQGIAKKLSHKQS